MEWVNEQVAWVSELPWWTWVVAYLAVCYVGMGTWLRWVDMEFIKLKAPGDRSWFGENSFWILCLAPMTFLVCLVCSWIAPSQYGEPEPEKQGAPPVQDGPTTLDEIKAHQKWISDNLNCSEHAFVKGPESYPMKSLRRRDQYFARCETGKYPWWT